MYNSAGNHLHLVDLFAWHITEVHIRDERLVYPEYHGINLRQQFLHEVCAPLFKSLRHDGVVGVVEGLLRDLKGFLEAYAVFCHKQADKLRYGDSRVSVVELNRVVLREILNFSACLEVLLEQVVEGGGAEEVLLFQSQQLAGTCVVEENLGKILDRGMRQFRDELVISTKAGYEMWDGPYGDRNGSRKYLTASLDQSLKRMKLDYVDIFYHHIFDPNTPLEETALALDNAVRQGKALYVGISNYNKAQTAEIMSIFKELHTPFVVNQPSYSMLNRWIESDGLRDFAAEQGIGLSVFSPLYQGLLTDRYLNGIPADSRIGKGRTWIKNELTDQKLSQLRRLNDIAASRGQKLSQMALSWVLREGKGTTVLIGASRPEQIKENVEAVYKLDFTQSELSAIDTILSE